MSPLIVVIDHDEAMQSVFASHSKDEGWTVSGYRYGEVHHSTIQEVMPDLIVLDFVQDHIGDGWTFLQLLRMEASTASIPVIISSAVHALPSEIAGYLASRNIRTISRMMDVERFILTVRQTLMGLVPLSSKERLPILLVEDNAEISSNFMLVLQMEGYPATTVPNGQLALDAVNQGRYSLIFLDIQMPVMTGHEFMAAYALQPGTHIPVIIFSAETSLRLENFPSFVIGRLMKPFAVPELLALLTQFVQPA
jgi:DNA-binding response OmpR family regulator